MYEKLNSNFTLQLQPSATLIEKKIRPFKMHFSCPVCTRKIQTVKDVVVATNVFGLGTFCNSRGIIMLSIVFAKLQNTKITRFQIAGLYLNEFMLKHGPKNVLSSKPYFRNAIKNDFMLPFPFLFPFEA